MLNMIADRIHIVRRMTSNLEKDVLTGIEHHEIASALMRRDDSKATALMQQHIRRHGERIRVFLMSGGSEDNFMKGERDET
jgi:DNA-binding GntR family transcriptional regulator